MKYVMSGTSTDILKHKPMIVYCIWITIKYPRRISIKASFVCPYELTCEGYIGGCVGVMQWLHGWFNFGCMNKLGYTVVFIGDKTVTKSIIFIVFEATLSCGLFLLR